MWVERGKRISPFNGASFQGEGKTLGRKRKENALALRKTRSKKGRCQGNWTAGGLVIEERFYTLKVEKWVEILQVRAWEYVVDLWEDVLVKQLPLKVEVKILQGEKDKNKLKQINDIKKEVNNWRSVIHIQSFSKQYLLIVFSDKQHFVMSKT